MLIRTSNDIGILIREARSRLGLTQAELARRLNTTQKWVSHIENGKPTTEIGAVLSALATLGVRMDFQLPSPPGATSASDVRHDDGDGEIPYRL